MVTFEETITHFKSRKTNEKNLFIDNVHKAIEAYRYVNKNYDSLDITMMYQNINEYFTQLKDNFSSMTTKTYITYINQTIDESIIKDNVNEVILLIAKKKIAEFIKLSDKVTDKAIDKPIDKATDIDIDKVKYEAELLHLRDENTWLRNLVMQITTN